MQQAEQIAGMGGAERGIDGAERRRVEAVVETLAHLHSRGENLAELAHDARNMVTALGLYCDLLEEPGVLAAPFAHYGSELRLVAAASRRLVEKLMALDGHADSHADGRAAAGADFTPAGFAAPERRFATGARPAESLERRRGESRHWEILPAEPVNNLAAELAANRNLLCALAGPSIALTLDAEGGGKPVRITVEDLIRVLVNLVKNAAEAMPGGGNIRIDLGECAIAGETGEWLALSVEDNGPGIPEEALGNIFASGYTTRAQANTGRGGWPAAHRGLGLAITRSIVENAGGHIFAANRALGGARFVIELPVR